MNKESLLSRIYSHQPTLLPETASESAVLLLIVYDENEEEKMHLVITKRSENITYPGDYCFPGGVKDLLDPNFDLTAMRELREELSIAEESYQMIGQLDDFHDRYGNRVRPFVAMISKKTFNESAQISNDEISDLHLFPMTELKAIHISEDLAQLTKRHPSYLYIKGDVRVWGLTASIMVHFSNLLFNLDKPIGKEVKIAKNA